MNQAQSIVRVGGDFPMEYRISLPGDLLNSLIQFRILGGHASERCYRDGRAIPNR
jgi:hypothetical protein